MAVAIHLCAEFTLASMVATTLVAAVPWSSVSGDAVTGTSASTMQSRATPSAR